jgi:hypothetical protein
MLIANLSLTGYGKAIAMHAAVTKRHSYRIAQ